MNKKILLAVLAIALVLGMTLAGCKEKDEENLDGTWTKDTFTFTLSGSTWNLKMGAVDQGSGTLSYGGGKITSTLGDETFNCNYSLSGNKLTITDTPSPYDNFNRVWTKQ
jgi:hypothetical protein